jgi:DMSO/TMAO reductase YedYZ molybdopterin-dependent catalytic subunit
MMTRRQLFGTAAGAGVAAGEVLSIAPLFGGARAAVPLSPGVPAGLYGTAVLEALPSKQKLIKLSYRPPNYEAPLAYFETPITPNDRFYVRYHLADIPEVDASSYKVNVGGEGARGRIELTLDDLRKFPAHEVVAVNQCSGCRRGLSQPHVPGVQWGYGAMGCARWTGARLKDVLDKVGLKKEAIEVAFNGADGPAYEKTPDFIKSLPLWKATDDDTLIAYEMNGAALPHFNGYPARLIVPGWTGTYWMKHLTDINVLTKPEESFWMKSAYRIPAGQFPGLAPFATQENQTTVPITEMVVNSLITSHAEGATVKVGKITLRGLAWDGGHGIASVQASSDGGVSWSAAELGEDIGRYAFRPWRFDLTIKSGSNTVMVNATNKRGDMQAVTLKFNPAGYHNNVRQSVTLQAV